MTLLRFGMLFLGLVLVTDAISALGLKEGRHKIGTQEIEIKNSHAYIAGTTTLCGSICSMNECAKIFKKVTGKKIRKIQNFVSLVINF